MAPFRQSETKKRYLVVVALPDKDIDARQTARFAKSMELTRAARARVGEWLTSRGFGATDFELMEPEVFGTFSILTTEAVAKALRGSPGVDAVLDAG